MAKRTTRSKRYDKRTYKVYGNVPQGNWLLNISMDNDYGLYQYVRRNHKALAKMPKDKAIRTIKSRTTENWSKQDLKSVNSRNVRAKDLKWKLTNFNR